MKRLLNWMAAGLFAVALAGCTSTAQASKPCDGCVHGVYYGGKNLQQGSFCMVNGKQVNCSTNPAECPTCKK